MLEEVTDAIIVKVEEDDHGHATLSVHGDPEIIKTLAQAVVLILASEADGIAIATEEELAGDEEDLGSSS